MGRSSAQPGDVMGQTHCRESSMFSPLHEHGWLHSPTPGQEREWDDRRSSHEQGQGLNSAKLHRQKTAVMQNEFFCVSAAVTVRRAQTSHLPCIRHDHNPPCVCSVFEGRHLDTAADDRPLALQEYHQRGGESIFHFSFGCTWLFNCFQSYHGGVFECLFYCIKLTADQEQKQSMLRYPWGHLGTKWEPWAFQLTQVQPHWLTHP